MFDPIGLRTTGFDRLEPFYQAALQPLSLSVLDEYPGARLRPRRAAHGLDRRIGSCAFECPHRVSGEISRRRRRVLRGCHVRGRSGQRRPQAATAPPPRVIRRLRAQPDGNNIEALCTRA